MRAGGLALVVLLVAGRAWAVCDPNAHATSTPVHGYTRAATNQCNWDAPYQAFIDESDQKNATIDYANVFQQQQTFSAGWKCPTSAANGKIWTATDANGNGSWGNGLLGCSNNGSGQLTCGTFVSGTQNPSGTNKEQILGNISAPTPLSCGDDGNSGALTILDTDNNTGNATNWEFCAGTVPALRDEPHWFPAGYAYGTGTLTTGDAIGWKVTSQTPTKQGAGLMNGMVLQFSNSYDCVDAGANTDCIFQPLRLPADWSGTVDVEILFTSADVTAGHTLIWTVASTCATPDAGPNGDTPPSVTNTVTSLTYTNAAGEGATKFRRIKATNLNMANCVAGDLAAFRIGRDATNDTSTDVLNFLGAEIMLRRKMWLKP